MSHYHVELIMPSPIPTVEGRPVVPPTPMFVANRVFEILLPLQKIGDNEDRWPANPLHDWHQIGGRFAGTKHGLRCDPERHRKFYEELHGEAFATDVTVIGGVRFWGDDQLPAVNALWRKWFPEDTVGTCPFIGPYPAGEQDICRVDRIPDGLTAHTVVVANEADEVVFRIDTEIWDGTRRKFQRTGFDGSALNALRRCRAGGGLAGGHAGLPPLIPARLSTTVQGLAHASRSGVGRSPRANASQRA